MPDLNVMDVQHVRRRMLRWGRANFQAYPWRAETDPWLTLVAEFLLQRTQATQVESVFMAFRERYPTARDFAAGGAAAARWATGRVGLHRRGLQLLEIAEAAARRGGLPPENLAELRRLPGVGMYTGAAWLSLYRGVRAVIIDANVVRWLSRMTGMPYNRDPRSLTWVKTLAERLTPQRAFRHYNFAVLDLTMTVCATREPLCARCPFRRECLYARRRGAPRSGGPRAQRRHETVLELGPSELRVDG